MCLQTAITFSYQADNSAKYFTACLLSFYQQLWLWSTNRDKLADFTAAVRDADLDAVVAGYEHAFETGRQPLLSGGLLDRLAVAELDSATLLRRRPGSTCLVRPAGDQVKLLLGDRSLTLPGRISDAVQRLVDTSGELRASDLHDVLDEQSALVLCRRMVREGLLEVVR